MNAIIFVGFKWPSLVLPQTYYAANNPCSLAEVSASVRKSWDKATSPSVPALTPPGQSLRGLLYTTARTFLLLLDSLRPLVTHLPWGVHMKTFWTPHHFHFSFPESTELFLFMLVGASHPFPLPSATHQTLTHGSSFRSITDFCFRLTLYESESLKFCSKTGLGSDLRLTVNIVGYVYLRTLSNSKNHTTSPKRKFPNREGTRVFIRENLKFHYLNWKGKIISF